MKTITLTVHNMFGVKQFFIFLIVSLTLVFSLSGTAQTTEMETPDETVKLQIDDPGFSFEMPPEYQTDLPQDKAREAPKPKTKPKRDTLFNLGFLGPIFQLIFYGLLAAATAFILYLILSTIIATQRSYVRKDKPEEIPDIPVYHPDAKAAHVLLGDADKLAAEGKYAEAVHILLFRSIQDIENKRPHHVKRSLTSREIADLSILTPKAREVFAKIGRLVETSFFGGRILGIEDYEVSKTAYKAFAFENVGAAKTARPTRSRR